MEDQQSSPTAPEDYRKEENEDSREEENDDSREEPDEENKESKEDSEKEKVDDNLLKKDKESIQLDIQTEGDDTATLPLRKKKGDEAKEKSKNKPSMYLFPLTRLKIAWSSSSNVCEFFFKAVLIIFSTLGWMFCVGGFPFISLALLIIGCIYIDDCKIQPNIPLYLIVSGVLGTIQHFIAIWTKYVPKDSLGRIKEYRNYCKIVDCVIQLFLTIWFVLGCIWVYGVYNEVEYRDTERNEYCNQTLYLFAFWILNFSFMILALLAVIALSCIVCVMVSPKNRNRETESIA
ncbi:uncharacterized protein LOC129961050 [Argiope bruennichi]|uniref:Transmembrane protein 272 like protein n=1 Tax=Argiope bruennichi TaxID=94029 RepID=A0A8T0FGF4_ARGBR|nr:uncharacterized protein LOC129961050 [Argiope bruennichi]XP_055930827.1 uncharacterized protein LOC129961050 [Argiope bruennichi]XP_055930828.1 uncharacterized protein LOC129961050 [Argiope bruennichi]KAF8790086.1 Transmembrane protein 272 like protein [Argiope bruennichi]